ncbi:putative lichenan-specific phosphotransferase enzyme IIA component [Clostridiales bacterium oral taxon 876 str. F0540]|nr:putative lichenan-specific phosphotransferase enzyme IIA component [Clostridiales bacterium oral taxon 876 str. F0540]
MNEVDYQETAFQLILSAGNAKAMSFKAINLAKANKFEEAYKCLEEAEKELETVHSLQFGLIQKEAEGEKNDISVLLIHSQDHFMDSLLAKDMAKEFIQLYERMNKIEKIFGNL